MAMQMFERPDFEPTPELRFVTPPGTTTLAPQLQQLWQRPTFDFWGHLDGHESEWRAVPTVIGEHIR